MQLKLAKKKEINEDVLRMIIQYGLGFASRVKNLENKEIEDWKEDKLYEKGAKVLYNNYLWVAKVTNQSSTWNENYWEKIGDDLELIEKSDIETMLGLTQDQLDTLASIILDSEIRLDKTHSSSKIFSDMQEILFQSKTFTLQEFAKVSKASYHVVSATSEMTDKSVIYLMPNSTNYDMYIVESDGTPTKIGDTTIDLSQFYTKTEIDNNFVKKTDADGKYATITTVDGKVDKTSILSTISSTPSDDKLLSEKAIKTELDTINTNLDDKVNKVSITTTIDSKSTSTDIASAKGVYDNAIKDKNIKTYTDISQLGLTTPITVGNIFKNMPDNSLLCQTVDNYSITDVPFGNGILIIHKRQAPKFSIEFKISGGGSVARNDLYIGQLKGSNGTGLTWSRVCTTKVEDVPKTQINFINGVKDSSNNFYIVKNGVCFIYFNAGYYSLGNNVEGLELASGLPKPLSGGCYHTYLPWATFDAGKQVTLRVNNNGQLLLYARVVANNSPILTTFSYLVAES